MPTFDSSRPQARPLSVTSRPADAAAADRQTWAGVLKHLRRAHPELCRQWFDNLEPIGFSSGVMQVRASSDVHRDYLQRSCINAFADAARAVTGLLVSVRFLGPSDDSNPLAHVPARAVSLTAPAAAPAAATPAPAVAALAANGHANPAPAGTAQPHQRAVSLTAPAAAPAAQHQQATPLPAQNVEPAAGDNEPSPASASAVMAELLGPGASASGHHPRPALDVYTDGLTLNPDNSFENFVVGPETRFAHAAALAVAGGVGGQYNPLFLHSAVGLGKTHLLQAVVLAFKARRPEALVYYTSCEGFMTQFMDAVQAGMMAQFRNKFRHVDMLLIDDIHFLAKRERTQEEFFHTFNALHQAGKQLVLSSDAAPSEIPELEARLVSRFNWGLVVKLDAPSFETREAIVKTKARMRGVILKDEVAGYIAGRIDSNIRELEGALTKLQVMADVERREIDLPLARAALGEGETNRIEPKVQMRTIIELVTDFFGVSEADLVSKRRHRSITQPRQVCMYLAREHTRFSLEEIGGHFGDRDHTTVMHAVSTVKGRCDTAADFKQTVKALEDRLKGVRA